MTEHYFSDTPDGPELRVSGPGPPATTANETRTA